MTSAAIGANGIGVVAVGGAPEAAAAGVTVSAGIAQADASGLLAAVSTAELISAGVGSATASGLQAGISITTTVAAGVAAADASGLAASVVTATVIAAGVAAAEAAGLGAQIVVAINVSAGIGSAAASGLQATVTAVEGTTISGGIGIAQALGLSCDISFVAANYLEKYFFDYLTGYPTQAGNRVYPEIAPEKTPLPRITYTRISTTPQNSFDGHARIDRVIMQVDCWERTRAKSLELGREARAALPSSLAFKPILQAEYDSFEPETRLYRRTLEFACWDKSF